MSKRHLAGLATCCVWASMSSAAVIGFDSFNDSRQPDFVQHIEDGFSVQVRKGDWREAFFFGTSAPSIFSRSDVGRIVVKSQDGGTFKAASVDVGNGSLFSGGVKYRVTGKLGNQSIFKVKGHMADLQSFNKVLLDESLVIDKLVINIKNQGAASYNLDNIAVSSAPLVVMPLPSSLPLMLATGVVFFGLRRRS